MVTRPALIAQAQDTSHVCEVLLFSGKTRRDGCLGSFSQDSPTVLGEGTFLRVPSISLFYFLLPNPLHFPPIFQQVIPKSWCKYLKSH